MSTPPGPEELDRLARRVGAAQDELVVPDDGPSCLEAALAARKLGFSVLPVGDDKRPLLGEWGSLQVKPADPDLIREWWKVFPDAWLGIVTGAVSGLVVVDVDSSDPAARAEAEQKFGATSRRARTPSEGWHLYYKHAGKPERNRVRIAGCTHPIDLRADCGYVVCPPSPGYTWERRGPWSALPPFPGVPEDRRKSNGSTDWAKLAEGVAEGERNDKLASLAGRWFRERTPPEALLAAALHFGASCRPPMDPDEVRRTVESVSRYHLVGVTKGNGAAAPPSSPADLAAKVEAVVEPQPGPTPDGVLAPLLDDLATFIRRYVVLGDHELDCVALWAVHCEVYAQFDSTPYLHIQSPLPRCGKSRLLEVLDLVCRNPLLCVGPSESSIFRQLDAEPGTTLLLDELDTSFTQGRENEDLRRLLNAGHRAGSFVLRNEPQGRGFTLKRFPTYCPKALAGLRAESMPATVRDRSIPIALKRKLRTEHTTRFRRRRVKPEAERLRERLQSWALAVGESLAEAEPAIPTELGDRAADGWEVLLALADRAGGTWPKQARAAAVALSGERPDEDGVSLGERLLADCKAVFAARQELVELPTISLLEGLIALPEAPWSALESKGSEPKPLDARRLAWHLRTYKVRSTDVGPKAARCKGYRRADFEDPWARYASPAVADGTHPRTRAPSTESSTYAISDPRTAAGENPFKSAESFTVRGCADKQPRTAPGTVRDDEVVL